MKKKIRILLLIILSIGLIKSLCGQSNRPSQLNYSEQFWRFKFDSVVNSNNNVNSLSKLLRNSQSRNSFLFMNLSYPMDGLLTMYKATKEVKYLEICHSLISNLINSSHPVQVDNIIYPGWLADSTDIGNKNVQGKEVILFEGYIVRYIAEYCYVLSQENNQTKKLLEYDKILLFVESIFLKWYNRSIHEFGDDSLLQTVRTYMGSHWAATANYLYFLEKDTTKNNIFLKVFSNYNKALRKNLNVRIEKGIEYYTWNATWDTQFYSMHNWDFGKSISQDISHSNQVVRYILDCYAIDSSFWKMNDIKLLINTLKLKILNSSNFSLPDNINGTKSRIMKFVNSGWRQSDGWIRLIFFDNSLFNSYLILYKNVPYIDRSPFNLEFYSTFYFYLKKQVSNS